MAESGWRFTATSDASFHDGSQRAVSDGCPIVELSLLSEPALTGKEIKQLVGQVAQILEQYYFNIYELQLLFLVGKCSDILKTDSDTNPLDKLPAILKKDLDKNLCVCNEVPKINIINAIVNGGTTVDAIKKQTYATMGSGCCIQQIERLIECLSAPTSRKKSGR